ncbi:hypothetical protein LSAT2_007521 [Lamellibrachia satsuma]|nr:hypothetical protein LSAT2_007521 [Lamellibrachia satsuma]
MTIQIRVILSLACAVLAVHYMSVSGNLNGRTFSLALTNLSTNVLGLQKMQNIIDKRAQVHSEKIDGAGIVTKLASALSMKFHAAFEAVNKISETLQEEYKQGYFNDTTSLSCCQDNERQMEYNFLFKKKESVATYTDVSQFDESIP